MNSRYHSSCCLALQGGGKRPAGSIRIHNSVITRASNPTFASFSRSPAFSSPCVSFNWLRAAGHGSRNYAARPMAAVASSGTSSAAPSSTRSACTSVLYRVTSALQPPPPSRLSRMTASRAADGNLVRGAIQRRDVAARNGRSGGCSGSDVIHIPSNARILLIGITGVTGRSALQGLLALAGPSHTPHTLLAMTRNPGGAAARSLPRAVQVVAGDLDEPTSLANVLQDVTAIYCHALSKDAAIADEAELTRAHNLAHAAKAAGVRLIIYNSSGGRGCGYGITQMEQKHRVEDILAAAVPTIALRASLFMEEFWKRYTRPAILKGTFTWSTPPDRPIQLVSARDMGLAAGCLLAGVGAGAGGEAGDTATAVAAAGTATRRGVDVQVAWDDGAPGREGVTSGTREGGGRPRRLRLRPIEMSGDELTPAQMCLAFSKVQGIPVRQNRAPAWPFWFLARDVFRISRFLTEHGYDGDVEACRSQFPGMTTFDEFLRATGWAEPAKTFEDGVSFTAPAETSQ